MRTTSYARSLAAGIVTTVALTALFPKEAAAEPADPYDSNFGATQFVETTNQDTDQNTDRLTLDAPSPLDDTISGLIGRINQLIQERRSVEAVNLALDALGQENLSTSAYDSIIGKIAEAEPYLHIDGTAQEAEELRKRIMRDLVSSHYDEKLISELGTTGFAQIIMSMRYTNSTTFEGGTRDTPGFAPGMSLTGGT